MNEAAFFARLVPQRQRSGTVQALAEPTATFSVAVRLRQCSRGGGSVFSSGTYGFTISANSNQAKLLPLL